MRDLIQVNSFTISNVTRINLHGIYHDKCRFPRDIYIWMSKHIYILLHYCDVIMNTIASQITSLTIVYLTVNSGTDQRKHQSSASLAFVRGIHRRPVNSPHKGPVTRKMFPFDDVIMLLLVGVCYGSHIQTQQSPNILLWLSNIILRMLPQPSNQSLLNMLFLPDISGMFNKIYKEMCVMHAGHLSG